MAVIQPGSFGDLMRRAPVLADQGGGFGAITALNAGLAARMAGDVMNNKSQLLAIEKQGDILLKAEKQRRNSTASRLAALNALRSGAGGSDGAFFGGGNSFAGGALAALLNQQSITPNQLLGDINETQRQALSAAELIGQWAQGSRRLAAGGASMS